MWIFLSIWGSQSVFSVWSLPWLFDFRSKVIFPRVFVVSPRQKEAVWGNEEWNSLKKDWKEWKISFFKSQGETLWIPSSKINSCLHFCTFSFIFFLAMFIFLKVKYSYSLNCQKMLRLFRKKQNILIVDLLQSSSSQFYSHTKHLLEFLFEWQCSNSIYELGGIDVFAPLHLSLHSIVYLFIYFVYS